MDEVNPQHYRSHASGIECIQIARHMTYNLGQVVKYVWRHGLKGSKRDALVDLRKAAWYLDDEIKRIELENDSTADAESDL